MNIASIEISYLWAVAGGVLYFLIGWAWYSKFLFLERWLAAQGKSLADISGQSGPGPEMALNAIGCLVVSIIVASIYEWAGGDGLVDGVVCGLIVGVGVVAMENLKLVVYDRQNWTVYLINNGYAVVGITAAGALYGALA